MVIRSKFKKCFNCKQWFNDSRSDDRECFECRNRRIRFENEEKDIDKWKRLREQVKLSKTKLRNETT